jgi:2-oxoglutarate dehydrogenase E2 component (dihydrolipoamide succinyltransferase)
VQDLNLFDISAGLDVLTGKARDNTLSPGDVRGGTFTISNHGVSGSLIATPVIINQPQSAILGVGKITKRVVVREIDGEDLIQIRPMCYISLTIDHRVLDAYQTNRFLGVVVDTLENYK